MEKLDPKKDGRTPEIISENIEKLRALFPEAFTEGADEDGPRWKADLDTLREIVGEYGEKEPERYSFTWNGKSRARLIAQTPSTGTLRPCPEESVNWDTTKNLFVEGDNLEVLKLLQKSYHKRVKMIYIDPPYNTGNDFIYPDKFADNLDTYLRYTGQIDDEGFKVSTNAETSGRYHTNWLNMMYPRLKLARNLLRDDGLILISIDDVEVANLQQMCDEIFGSENRVEQVAWKNKYGSGALTRGFANVHEYILVYSKTPLSNIAAPLDDEQRKAYKNKDEKYSIRGGYMTQPLATTSKDDRPNLRYPIAYEGVEIWPEKQWIWSQDRFQTAYDNDEIVINERNGKYSVRMKQYLRDENGVERLGKPISLLNGPFNQEGTKEIKELFDRAVFDFPKPSSLIRYFFSFVVNDEPEDAGIYLDFFAGSCSSAQALLDLNVQRGGNRRFIMVQLPESCPEGSEAKKAGYDTIASVGRERIRRVLALAEKEHATKRAKAGTMLPGTVEVPSAPCVGFRSLKLDSSNIKPWDPDFDNVEQALLNSVDNIKPDRSEHDVLYELLLKYGLDLAVPIETRTVLDKKVYVIGGGALIVCLGDGINANLAEGVVAIRDEIEPEVIRVVFKDSGFEDDVAKTNVMQVLKQAGIEDVKSL